MKLKTTNQPVSWLQVIFLLIVIVYCSCKKTDTKNPDTNHLYEEQFFKKPVNSTEELNTVIDMLKAENEKSGFVSTLPGGAGLPVWDKLIVEKPSPKPGEAARGIIADKNGNLLIPMSNDSKTLSALLFAMKINDQYEFRCYDNNYAYGITFSDSYTIKEREKVIGLFMGMSNYVFGIRAFKNIPKELYEGFSSAPEENGDTKKVFLMLASGTLPDIFLSDDIDHPGPTTGPTKCYWEFTGKCNCAGSDNTAQNCKHPNDECPSGICTKKTCFTLIFDNESGPGIDPPPGNPNNGTSVPPIATSTSNWSNNNGYPLPEPSTSLPNSPCGNTNCTWYTDAPEYVFEQCDPNSHMEEQAEFNEYIQMTMPASMVLGNNSNSVQEPTTGTYTWTIAAGSIAGWKIQAVTEYGYRRTRYYTVDGTAEDIFDIYLFKTGEGYFVGSQTFISSTYTTRHPTINQVYDNNTQNARGESRVIGTVQHKMKMIIPFCENTPELDFTDEVDNKTIFIPR